MVLKLLEAIKNNSTEAGKKKILLENKNMFEFTETLRLALDPREVFYIKTFDYPVEFEGVIILTEAFAELKKLQTGEVSGNSAIKFVTTLLSKLTERDAEVLFKVIIKRLDCDMGVKTVNSVYGNNFIFSIPYMRCDTLSEITLKNVKFPALLQEKMDGQFIYLICNSENSISCFSRSGVEYDFLGAFDALCSEVVTKYGPSVLVGELLVLKEAENNIIADRQTGNGIIQKGCKGTLTLKEASSIHLVAWDLISCEDFYNRKSLTPYSERLKKVEDLSSQKMSKIPSITVNNEDEVYSYVKQWIKEGKEGGILKVPNGIWKDGTSKEQLKVKNIFEVDLEIIGFQEGEKNSLAEGTLGSLICQSSDGILKCKVSGMTWEMREKLWANQDKYLGKILSVAANKTSKNKNGEISLYLPRFIEIRTDKTEADSYERILEQEKGVLN